MTYLVPLLLILLLGYAFVKKVNVYKSFVLGASGAVNLCVTVLPYLVAMYVMVFLLRQSGISNVIVDALCPLFDLLGVPKQVLELMLLRPFSGSGSLALLKEVYVAHGVDSYVGRCASVIMGSSETVFYVASIYFAQTPVKNTGWAVPIALACNLVGGVLACWLCKIL